MVEVSNKMPDNRKKSNDKDDNDVGRKYGLNRVVLAFVVIFAVIGAYFAFQAFAAPPSSSSGGSHGGKSGGGSQTVANLSIVPASAKISASSDETFQVWEDSLGDQVNAVQANLSYPADKFDFVNIDSSNSAFGVTAPSNGGNGTITIARGTVNPVVGKQLVASFTLKPTVSSGKASIDFTSGSAIERSTDNQNTLQQTYGGTYTLTH